MASEKLKNLTLDEYRRQTRMTHSQLALMIGCAHASVWNWCHTDTKPHPALRKQITKRTGGVVNKF